MHSKYIKIKDPETKKKFKEKLDNFYSMKVEPIVDKADEYASMNSLNQGRNNAKFIAKYNIRQNPKEMEYTQKYIRDNDIPYKGRQEEKYKLI